MEGLSLADQLEQEQQTTMSLHKRLCKAFDKLERRQKRLESETNRVGRLQEELKAAKSTKVLNELWQQIQDAKGARDAVLKEQVQQQLRAAQTDSVLAEVREQLRSEKAARAVASRDYEKALQGQAAVVKHACADKLCLEAQLESAKQQLAGAASQQSHLQQELKRAQQQCMTASADNGTLKTQLQAMQEQLANATAVTDALRAQLQAAEQHSQAWDDEKRQLQNTINVQAEKVFTLTNLNLAFRSGVEKAHAQRKRDVAELEGVNSHLQSQIRKLQKIVNCMPTPKQAVDKEGKAAEQHNDQSAVAAGHRTAVKTAPAAAFKSHMGFACKQRTTTEAAGSDQHGKVAAKSAADQASSGIADTGSRAPADPHTASAHRKATQPVASKASRAQAVRPSTAGGIVKSAAARIAAFLPASNASGCQVKATPSRPVTKHEQGSRDAVMQAEHAKPAHATVTHNLTGVKRKRVTALAVAMTTATQSGDKKLGTWFRT